MNNSSFKRFTLALEYIIKYFKAIIAFALALVVFSGVYTVESHEVAVVLRFGRLVGDSPANQIREPGLHFALPFFIDQVVRVPVHTIHEREITTHYVTGAISPLVTNNGYLLTGDNNIVLMRATVRYQISNPAQYALFSNDAGTIIDGIVSGEITRLVTTMNIDTVLTTGRGQLGQQILTNSQAIINNLHIGTTLTSLELTDIVPPAETAAYFEAVRSASVTRETNIQQAREQANTLLLEAYAISNATIQQATLEQTASLTTTHNVIAEFNGLHDQYIINPQIIRQGVFRQRVGDVLSLAGNTIIVPDDSDPPLLVLP